jgi:hypothetical protein
MTDPVKPQDYPRRTAWCEGTLTRADEIEALADWAVGVDQKDRQEWGEAACRVFRTSIDKHLAHARDAASTEKRIFRRTGARLESAISSLDAAEADLLHLAPADYVVGQMPSILNHVVRHLQPTDTRRLALGRIATQVGVEALGAGREEVRRVEDRTTTTRIINDQRGVIVGAVRGASSAALRETTRVRSFRNVVVATAAGMFIVAVGLVVTGVVSPTTVPLCFAPQDGDKVTVVCPTEQSGPIPNEGGQSAVTATAINKVTDRTVSPIDIFIVAVLGATAAAVAGAAAIRKIRGSSEPYGVPIALAVLKLPTGAVTAVLGLVLMRGGFVPGLSALDTSAQILAWAAIFGYAQQLFTRLVDQQAHTVLDSVRGGDKATTGAPST